MTSSTYTHTLRPIIDALDQHAYWLESRVPHLARRRDASALCASLIVASLAREARSMALQWRDVAVENSATPPPSARRTITARIGYLSRDLTTVLRYVLQRQNRVIDVLERTPRSSLDPASVSLLDEHVQRLRTLSQELATSKPTAPEQRIA